MDFEDKFPHPNETHKSGPIRRMAQLRPFHQKGIDAATRRFRFGAAQRSFVFEAFAGFFDDPKLLLHLLTFRVFFACGGACVISPCAFVSTICPIGASRENS